MKPTSSETSRQKQGVFLGIERSFLLTCENVSILGIKAQESNVSIVPVQAEAVIALQIRTFEREFGEISR
jgi:hypothetical protein